LKTLKQSAKLKVWPQIHLSGYSIAERYPNPIIAHVTNFNDAWYHVFTPRPSFVRLFSWRDGFPDLDDLFLMERSPFPDQTKYPRR
jgi:hypothetical protein